MKYLAVFLMIVCAASVYGQDLPKDLPSKPEARTGDYLRQGEEAIRFSANQVLVPRKDDGSWYWHVEEVNSCEFCGRPMTFKAAATDKKMSFLWVAEIALSVADIEILVHSACYQDKTCREGNPLLGGGGRKAQYGIRMPVLAGAWIGTAWLRKGNIDRHIGGMRRWWVLPLLYHGAAVTGIVANLAR